MPHTLGVMYRLFGVHIVTGRLINLGAMLLLVVILTRVLLSRPSRWAVVPGVVLLIGVHNRALEFTTETRPDMVALFFAGLGVILLYRGF